MAVPAFLRLPARLEPYICVRCSTRAARIPGRSARRSLHLSTIAKREDAEKDWQAKAAKIRAGEQQSMLSILEERGLIHTISGTRLDADNRLTDKRLGAYVGIDPTAASLHVGHLLPFMALFWMFVHGYHSVIVLGGATAKIGDPTGRLTTRETDHRSTRTANMTNMHFQLKKLWQNLLQYARRWNYGDVGSWAHKRDLVNNNFWWNKQPMLQVLQVMGHGMRIGPMLAKDTVKNKLQNGDGMSFSEFSYPIMQAWDWWMLYHTKGIQVQIGGADQYGNITAGIDAIKHISKNHSDPDVRNEVRPLGDPFGFTVPLLTTSSGAKFGKSAGNAIWLSEEQTSVFDQYGHFLKTSDADVAKHLKLLTFMPLDQIDTLVKEHEQDPSQRKAQHMLAREVMYLVHGSHAAELAEKQHRLMFGKSPDEPALLEVRADPDTLAGYTTLNNRPNVNIQLPRSVINTLSIGRIIYAAGLASSASDGNRLVQQQSVYICGMNLKPVRGEDNVKPMLDGSVHWVRCKAWHIEETAKYLIHGDLLMLRKGKANVRVIQVVPDEEYDAAGKSYPGQKLKGGPLSDLDKRSQKAMDDLQSGRGMDNPDSKSRTTTRNPNSQRGKANDDSAPHLPKQETARDFDPTHW